MRTALQAADEVIAGLKTEGYDYSPKREEIASLFQNTLWQGNWDSSTDFDDETRNLRLIQEDEFDQHGGGGDLEFDDQLCFAAGHYVFFQ